MWYLTVAQSCIQSAWWGLKMKSRVLSLKASAILLCSIIFAVGFREQVVLCAEPLTQNEWARERNGF